VKARHLLALLAILAPVASMARGQSCISDSIFADGFDTTGVAPPIDPCIDFPRLGGMLIGNPHNYHEPAYQAQIARLDLAVLGMYNLWSMGGQTPAQAIAAIKAHNPAIRLGNYTIMSEVDHADNPSTQYKRDKLETETGPDGIGDWWAYDAAGNHTDWSGGDYGSWDVNLTLLTTADANGDHWPQWLARADHQRMLQDAGFDIWYCDNNFWQPRSDIDFNRDGVIDAHDGANARTWWRDGQRAYYATAKSIAPDLLVMVNADSDLDGSVFPPKAGPFDQYRQFVHGAFMEHAMGKDWSAESWGGWPLVMAWYRQLTANLLPPQAVVFDVWLASTGDYRFLRYAFATSLMGDAYFSASTDYNEIVWFDEYDLAGTASTKWLGRALDPPQTQAWQQGVYRRRFEHGMALVNPKDNGPQTVTLEPGYRRFLGNQAPAVNHGEPVTGLTLADRDGILLIAE
jgi:hypothetical protein